MNLGLVLLETVIHRHSLGMEALGASATVWRCVAVCARPTSEHVATCAFHCQVGTRTP